MDKLLISVVGAVFITVIVCTGYVLCEAIDSGPAIKSLVEVGQ